MLRELLDAMMIVTAEARLMVIKKREIERLEEERKEREEFQR
jgi:hypothetical protein